MANLFFQKEIVSPKMSYCDSSRSVQAVHLEQVVAETSPSAFRESKSPVGRRRQSIDGRRPPRRAGISSGIDQLDLRRRAASYVDRILKEQNPPTLPFKNDQKALAKTEKLTDGLDLELRQGGRNR